MTAPAAIIALAICGATSTSETVVSGQRSADGDAVVVVTDDTRAGEDALLAVPGVALARDGGPLTSSRPLLRGLGGARLHVDVAGLTFSDPVSGDVDASLLPFALGRATVDVGAGDATPDGLGGSLSLRPGHGSFLRLTVGELTTLMVAARVQVPVDAGTITAAVDAGSSRGDFRFAATDAIGSEPVALTRSNNDQRRLRAAVVADLSGPAPSPFGGQLRAHLVAAGAAAEGGVPGFATAPLLTQRLQTTLGAIGGRLVHQADTQRITLAVAARGSDRRTHDVDGDSIVAGGGGDADVAIDDMVWRNDDVSVAVGIDVGAGQAVIANISTRQRSSAGGRVRASTAFGPELVATVGISGAVAVVGDLDRRDGTTVTVTEPAWLPTGALRASLQRHDGALGVRAALVQTARAPTLDERFAPAGFIQAAPGLQPERVTDLEVGVFVAPPGDFHLRVSATGFGSRLDEAIVVVNQNAFQISPANTGPAWRAGTELQAAAAFLDERLTLSTAATLLISHVEATAAPLPTAPPLALRSTARVGDDAGFIAATLTARGAAPSTIFGTLPSGAYALVDFIARIPLADHLATTFTIENAFDVQTARDSNLLPLPGRLIFVALEVRT